MEKLASKSSRAPLSAWSASKRKSVVNTSTSSRTVRSRIALAAFLILLLDDASKSWAITALGDGHIDRILGSFLQLQLTSNSGAAFNLATSRTYFLTSFSALAILALLLLARRITPAHGASWALPLGLALGGIMGNLSDRIFRAPGIFRGSVIDWIRLPHWPTFNIADSSLVIAAIMTLYLVSSGKSPWADENDITTGNGAAS